MNNLVSVIVPSFNNETHTAATLGSIIAQDYENLEIIFVNDASTDNTLAIAENTLKNSGRVFKIINHEKNRGESAARNSGLDASNGNYICFCDGDDLLKENYISLLASKIKENDCEISFCGMIDRFEDGRSDVYWPVKIKGTKIINGDEALRLSPRQTIAPSVCCMMFKKNFIIEKRLRFSEGCTACEDKEFQLEAFCRAKKISFTTECLYIYVHSQEMGSVRDANTAEKKLRRYVHATEALERAAEYLSHHAPSERVKLWAENYLMPEVIIRRFTIAARMSDYEKYKSLCRDKNLRAVLKRSRKIIFSYPEIFFKAFAILYMPKLYYLIRRKN
ncbi:MAG: glycosyltransferase family 2 protein [Synergistaceae bacterium]|nr:glycosyltransferase family 2 protein [Synergistaceae bacterium]